ncbi:hypothetical protein PENSPDRAFT_688299 [Peniophora sp. CONT]|nr:hypothetical protein PENSPDRAFT_688299 [Peniophora sp. CONT]
MSQPPLNLGPSLGALEVGVFVAYFLSGINAVQAFIYYQSEFHNDSRYIKSLIALVVTIEMVHSGLIGAYVYNATIDNFGNYLSLDHTPWTLAMAIPIGSLAQAIVQLFFAFRVYIVLRKQIWIPLMSTILTLVHFAISIVAGVESGRYSISEFTVRYRYLVVLALVTGAAADTINTATLVYALHRSRGQITQSRKMIERLILWSTETGLLVTAVSFLGLILVFALPDKPAWLVVVLVFAKLYSNTMLATFNGRVALRSTGNRAHISVLTMTGENTHGLTSNPHGSPVHVQMTRQKVIMRDGQWDDTMEAVDGEDPSKDAQSLSAPFASDLEIGTTIIAAGDHGAKV